MRNSTIISKKRRLSCGCFDFAFSKNRCKAHATIESTNKRIAEHEDELETESLQNLVADLDMVFSRYIRLRSADKQGYLECYTSGKRLLWQEAQCGHFISRSNYATRWMEQNVRPQSDHDNCALHGNLKVFAAKLEEESKGITEWLLEQSRQVYKPTRDELKQLLIEYRYKLKLLK